MLDTYRNGDTIIEGFYEFQEFDFAEVEAGRTIDWRAWSKTVAKCPYCSFESIRAYETYGQKINDELVTPEVFTKYLRNSPKISLLARKEPHSILLHGETGKGKTLLMKLWFNKLLRRGLFPVWLKEKQIYEKFRDREEADLFKRTMADRRIWFIDECWRPENWNDQDTDRHYAMEGHGNFFEFWDEYLYSKKEKILMVLAGNREPATIIHKPELVRKIQETCADNIVDVTMQQDLVRA